MTYDEWEASVPAFITEDTLWRVEAYRLGLFLSDLAWEDAGPLARRETGTLRAGTFLIPSSFRTGLNFQPVSFA